MPPTRFDQFAGPTVVPPNAGITDLQEQYRPDWLPEGITKKQGAKLLQEAKDELFALQDRFYADGNRALLILLQGMDASGKDGTIKHVMEGVNPQGVEVHSFKAPSHLDMSHDFLWRNEIAAPRLGQIGIFNRSQYENVLITRVHPELIWPKTSVPSNGDIWQTRYRQINDWERRLEEQGTTIVKLFLNLSKEEQARRFLSRIDDPAKNWKVSPSDMKERGYWNDYLNAFTEMLNNTSTDYAPWHVLPADNKWFLRLAAVSVILGEMRAIDPKYPTVSDEDRANLAVMRAQLEKEG